MADLTQLSPVEVEEALIGSLLISPEEVLVIAQEAGFKKEEFSDMRCQTVWDIACELAAENKDVDFITVGDALKHRGLQDDAFWLMTLLSAVPTSVHAESYLRTVREANIRREVVLFAERSVQLAYSPNGTQEILSMVGDLHAALPVLPSSSSPVYRTVSTGKEAVEDLLTIVQDNLDHRRSGDYVGVSFGIPALDAMIGDVLIPGELAVIYAKRGVGKSMVLDDMALEMGRRFKSPEEGAILIYPTERSRTQVMSRWMAAEVGMDARVLYSAGFEDSGEMWERIMKAADAIALDTIIIDHGDVSAAKVAADVKRLRAQGINVRVVVVDFLQQMDIYGTSKSATRAEQLSRTTYDLKRQVAVQLGVVVFVASSVNKKGDIEGAEAIEHGADLIFLLEHHPEQSGAVLATLTKNRSGPSGLKGILRRVGGWFDTSDEGVAPQVTTITNVPEADIADWHNKGVKTNVNGRMVDASLDDVLKNLYDGEVLGVTVVGKSGSGKTHMASALARAVHDATGKTAFLWQCTGGLPNTAISDCLSHGVVVIDDIHVLSQPWEITNLKQILDTRVRADLPTILTTGMTSGDLMAAWNKFADLNLVTSTLMVGATYTALLLPGSGRAKGKAPV